VLQACLTDTFGTCRAVGFPTDGLDTHVLT